MKKNTSTKELKLSNNEKLYLESKSLFQPNKFENLFPDGLKIYTFHAGFKKKFKDLLVIVFDKTASVSCVYSKTSMPSAPIIWDKINNKGKVKALIVNSGNANAHTGVKGIDAINNYVNFLCRKINCKPKEVLVSSTGVIGEQIEPNLITKQFSKIDNSKQTGLLDAAKAIMTTDTYPKISTKKIKIDNKIINIFGIAKGSGMICPNMGTMLAYIFIDVDLSRLEIKKFINNNLEETFNSISVDGDTSTSDTFALFSIKKNKINLKNIKNFNKINSSIFGIMQDLSLKVIKDGEGLSKLLVLKVNEAKSKKQAKNIGFSIINSPLVKTAIAGEDANWGRIVMAIGKSQEPIAQNKLKVFFGKNMVCKNGSANKLINTHKLNKYMKNKVIEITVYLKNGNINHTVYGNDLTNDYLTINSDYRS